MGYEVVTDSRLFLGYSTDAKPSLTAVNKGCRLEEIDPITGIILKYVWSGTEWVADQSLYTAVKMALEDAV
jgi:hypothetical protein